VAGKADKKCNTEAQRIGQLGPHLVLCQCKYHHVRERRYATHHEKPEN